MFALAVCTVGLPGHQNRRPRPFSPAACPFASLLARVPQFLRIADARAPDKLLTHRSDIAPKSLAASPLFSALTKLRKCSFCTAFSPVFSTLTQGLAASPLFCAHTKYLGGGPPQVLSLFFSITYKLTSTALTQVLISMDLPNSIQRTREANPALRNAGSRTSRCSEKCVQPS
jgi:hypothetical protein